MTFARRTKLTKRLLLFAVIVLLVSLPACSTEPRSSDDAPIGEETSQWIKEVYFQYLQDHDLLDKTCGPKEADDLIIQTYVGTYGDGCVVAYLTGDGLAWTAALRPETYGENTIVFGDGQLCYAFYQSEVYTIGQAYEKGILTDDDILSIDAVIGIHE